MTVLAIAFACVAVFAMFMATRTPGSHSRAVAPAGWGMRFLVDDRLSQTIDPTQPAPAGIVLFSTAKSERGGGLVVVDRQILAQGFTVETTIQHLADVQTARDLLPGGVGAGADVAVVRRAAETSVGAGWPGVSAEYAVTLAPDKEPLFGQHTLGFEIVMFWHAGYLYGVMLFASPANEFDAHRSELERTLRTIQPV